MVQARKSSGVGMPRGTSARASETPGRGARARRSKAAWALQILVAFAFLGAGGAKLAGADQMVELFDRIGTGHWLRFLTGALEVVGAALLFRAKAAFWGALLLACIMTGATFTHLVLIGGSPVPAITLLVLTLGITWLRRPGRRKGEREL